VFPREVARFSLTSLAESATLPVAIVTPFGQGEPFPPAPRSRALPFNRPLSRPYPPPIRAELPALHSSCHYNMGKRVKARGKSHATF